MGDGVPFVEWTGELRSYARLSGRHGAAQIATLPGSNGGEVTPVPMPNTEVKLSSADGSWGFAPARVGRRQAIHYLFIDVRNELSLRALED